MRRTHGSRGIFVHAVGVMFDFCYRKFSLNDLLTNVMIYWTTSSIIPSMRFYKENLGKGLNQPHSKYVKKMIKLEFLNYSNWIADAFLSAQCFSPCIFRIPVLVPTGLAVFPNELVHVPELWARQTYHKLVSYTQMPRGGHFAAMEEPELMAEDIQKFVKIVEGDKWRSIFINNKLTNYFLFLFRCY